MWMNAKSVGALWVAAALIVVVALIAVFVLMK